MRSNSYMSCSRRSGVSLSRKIHTKKNEISAYAVSEHWDLRTGKIMRELLIHLSRYSVYQGRWMTMRPRWQAKRCKLSKKLLIPLCLPGAHLRRLLLQKTLNGKLIKKKHAVSPPTALMKSELRRRKLCVQRGLQLDNAKTGGEKFRRILGSYIQSVTFIADLSTAALTGHRSCCSFLCDRSVVRWWGIKDALCTWKRTMPFLRGHAINH